MNYIPIAVALVFAVLAGLHRLGINEPGYTESPLIPILMFSAMFLLPATAVLFLIALVAIPIALYKKDWNFLKLSWANFIGVTFFTWLGFTFDAPTLLFMT